MSIFNLNFRYGYPLYYLAPSDHLDGATSYLLHRKKSQSKGDGKPDYSKKFQVLEAGDNDIAGLVYKGKLIALKAWEDANGHNFLVLSIKESERRRT